MSDTSMEDNPLQLLAVNRNKIKSTISAENLLSLLLAAKLLEQDDVLAFQTLPTEKRIDFLLDTIQGRNNDNLKAFLAILCTQYPQLKNLSARRNENLMPLNEQKQEKFWTNEQIWPINLYATFGSRRAPVSRSVSNPQNEQRPSSLRMRPKEREDIRFFFQKEQTNPSDKSLKQQNMPNDNTEIRRSNAQDKKHQNEYDRLRDQCINAMNELETLRKQHQEIVGRCDLAVQEAEYHRKQHKAILQRYDQVLRESNLLRVQYDQALSGKSKLQQDYEEIVLLREKEKLEKEDVLSPTIKNRSRVGSILDDNESIISENGKLRDENEALRAKLEELEAAYALATSTLSKSDEESMRSDIHYDSLVKERDSLVIERDALRQQCTAAIREYDKALRDRDEAIQASISSDQQMKLAIKESEVCNRMKYSKEISRMQEERNAALKEYKLVMSERDTVHREIEKLQDDLENAQKNIDKLSEEKEKIQHEAECLRQEINTVLVDRDQSVKESYNLKERLQEALKDREQILKKFEELKQDFEMRKQERDAARKERSEAISHRDKILKECFEVQQLFESAGENREQENQLLKHKFEALSIELTEAWKEAEVAMFRRDWAFGERNKIVRELQKLGDRCNVLTKERDQMMEDFTSMQNKYESFKVQNDRLFKELIGLKKYRDTKLSKDERLKLLMSTDSAIDTDSNEYELETVELERMSKDEDFGFVIGGGVDTPLEQNDTSIFVTEVVPDSIAYEKLRVNDCLLKVNEIDLSSVNSELANQAIQGANFLSLSVLRKRQCLSGTSWQRVRLIRTEDKDLGLSIDSGLHIKRIEPGSIAAEDETLSIGDKILTINGSQIENLPYKDAKTLLKRSVVSLTVLKANTSTASSHRSLSNQLAEQDKESSESRSCDTDVKQSSPYTQCKRYRSPSATISMPGRIPELPNAYHSRRHSMVSGSSLGSYAKLSPSGLRRNTLSEAEQKRYIRELSKQNMKKPLHESKSTDACLGIGLKDDNILNNSKPSLPSSSPPSLSHRSNSYMTAIISQKLSHDASHITTAHDSSNNTDKNTTTRRMRPRSAPGPRHYVNNTSNLPRHEILLQNGTSPSVLHFRNRSDAFSLGTIHNNCLSGSVGRQARRQRPHLSQYASYNANSKDYDRTCNFTLPTSNRRSIDALEKRNMETANNSMYSARNHHKSASSRASSTSSVSSGFMTSHNFIKPLYEEESPSQNYRQDGRKISKENAREGEPRVVVVAKGIYPLGISIGEGVKGGIMVTMVNENSAAATAGLRHGDQLLEFNGINLRSATFGQAALILKQSADADTVTVLAQYNPNKLLESDDTKRKVSQTDSSQSTPQQTRRSANAASNLSSYTKQNSALSTITAIPVFDPQSDGAVQKQEAAQQDVRHVVLKKINPTALLGINIIGGNAHGIYVSEIEPESVASLQGGLMVGDHILEMNGVSFLNKTAEQATLELVKPTESAKFLVQYDYSGFRKAKEQSYDSFYVRALFDRVAHNKEDLSFKKGDILHVKDTLYQKKLGIWKAWHVSETNGLQKREGGTIPSKAKAEEEILLRRCSIYSDEKLKMRHSFFRRSKKSSHSYNVSHSRESSDSRGDDAGSSIGSNSTAFANDGDLMGYQKVQRFENHFMRPVIVLGPMAEPICDKLVMEWPYKFARSLPEIVRASREIVEKDLEAGMYVDYSLSRRGTSYACITENGIKEVVEKSKHCLLDVNPSCLDRLLQSDLYPIIVLLKYKSHKQIKDLRDGHYIRDKITSKEAKEMFEVNVRIEKEHKVSINAVVSGSTLNNICSQIIDRVQEEQEKALWVNI